MLKRLEAVRYVTPLREGGSLPAIVETDEASCYVAKFRGAGQGAGALIAEVIAGEIARTLGLPVPEIALIGLAAGFGRTEPDPEIRELLAASEGTNLGLAFLPASVTFDPVAEPTVEAELASDIVWFDALVTNVDRTARNTNLLVSGGRLYLIDHGSTLYFHHSWAGYEARIRTPFPAIRTHVLLPAASRLEESDARLVPLLDEAAVRRIVGLVPDEWLATPPAPFADEASHREAYVGYLLERLRGPRDFVVEAIDARADLV